MKNIVKKYLLGLVTCVVVFSSCEKDINDINENNPNQFNDSDPILMLTGAQLANVMLNEGDAARLSGIFSGHFTGVDRQYVSYNNYTVTSGDFDAAWANLYANGIAQCRLIRAKAVESQNKALEGVACITEANLLLTASSLWGHIPNTQACNPQIDKPDYDNMSDVYDYCISLLDKAIPLVGSSSAYSAAYAGSFSWSDVASTIKARAHLHKGEYQKAIDAATNGIAYGEDLMANHSANVPGAWNLYYDFLDWNRAGYMSADGSYLASLMDTTSGNPNYRGNAKTDESNRLPYYFTTDGYSALDPNWIDGAFASNADFPIVSYVENELILSESYWRTSDFTNALVHLNNARKYNDSTYGGFDPYVQADFTDNNALLKEILVEKYVSLYGQIEAFTDVRRTNNLIGVKPNKGTKLPQRFLYPQSELNTNKANVDKYYQSDVLANLSLWP
ncbi:MAG: SusD/RagB family nutrient-binding outer membrane lipoprotein [Bacteroidota bacterium]|jgi:hypothetical protein